MEKKRNIGLTMVGVWTPTDGSNADKPTRMLHKIPLDDLLDFPSGFMFLRSGVRGVEQEIDLHLST